MIFDARNLSGSTMPIWTGVRKAHLRPGLRADTEAEVCVIGGGITGISCAAMLAEAGKSVILLEDGRIGTSAGATRGR